MSRTCHTVDKSFFDAYSDVIAQVGVPKCRECGKQLAAGDQVDGHWPYFSQYNLCRKCMLEDARGKRKSQWEAEARLAKPTENPLEMWLAEQLVHDFRNAKRFLSQSSEDDRGYWEGILQEVTTLIAIAPVSKQAWQAAGLTFDEMEECLI